MFASPTRAVRFHQAEVIVRLGLIANVVLMIFKLLAGTWGRSDAVFADGIESAADLAITAASLVALRISRQPLDPQHPYGHGRVESITALLIGCAIALTGVWILYRSIAAIATHDLHRPGWIAAAAAAGTILAKELLARYTFAAANRLGSPVLRALGQDHRKDAITSIATLVGCVAALLGGLIFDPLVAGITALLILYAGVSTFRRAAHELMDTSLPNEQLAAIGDVALSIPGVEHVHEIKGRRSGQYLIVDLKLEMDPQMTVLRSHAIATQAKQRIFEAYPEVGDVMIHINPHDDPHHQDLVRL